MNTSVTIADPLLRRAFGRWSRDAAQRFRKTPAIERHILPLVARHHRTTHGLARSVDNIIADLRNLPLPVCLHEFGVCDTACDKEIFWIVRAGLTTLPHVHRNEIGTNGRPIAVYRDIVPRQKMLRSFQSERSFFRGWR